MNRLVRCVSGTAVALALVAGAQAADLKVGLSVSLSGPIDQPRQACLPSEML